MPTILGANSVSGYDIDNSMRFNRGDTACLRKTFSGSPTSTKICTISFWTKLADPSNTDAKCIFSAIKSGSNEDFIKFMGVNNGILNALELGFNNTNSGSMMLSVGNDTLIKFRDPSAWYHFVIAIDSSQGTASNRLKAYVNGTQRDVESRVEGGSITDDVVLTEDYELGFLTASAHSVGENVESAGNEPYDGYLADFNFIDGQQLDPSYFGETNDNGVWIPKKYAGGYGNYGFFLEFQQTGTSANASGKGADTSGNGNHFDDNGATAEDITTDTPTNNFCTMNPLDNYYAQATFSEGNCKFSAAGSPTTYVRSTQGVTNGKWYWEVKIIDKAGGTSIGVQEGESPGASDQMGYNTAGVQLRQTGQRHTNGGNANYMAAQSNNDIVMIAFDRDNSNVYFGANGQWGDGSGNTDEANPSSAIGITVSDFVFPALGDMDGSGTVVYEANFGNPSFTISSSNSDANGHGSFEYAVPSGYFALCTKNLAEFG